MSFISEVALLCHYLLIDLYMLVLYTATAESCMQGHIPGSNPCQSQKGDSCLVYDYNWLYFLSCYSCVADNPALNKYKLITPFILRLFT